jgi:hypothetical protein
MPYRSERQAILKSINRQLFFTGTWMSLLDTEDPLRPEYEQRVIKFMGLRMGILSTRYINAPLSIPKSKEFRELIWNLPDNEFKQEARMDKSSFYHVSLITFLC